MSVPIFSRSAGTLSFNGQTFPAANNVAHGSNGPWPAGTYPFIRLGTAEADGPDGAFGSYGIFIFDVPGRTGMGIHSGRANDPDGLGRVGVLACTEGCVRTTDEGVAALIAVHAVEPVTGFVVG